MYRPSEGQLLELIGKKAKVFLYDGSVLLGTIECHMDYKHFKVDGHVFTLPQVEKVEVIYENFSD